MKKLLLASAISALVAGSAMAEENAIYLRADAGVSILPDYKFDYKWNAATQSNLKFKGQSHFVGALGVGYSLMDNVRVELDFISHFNGSYKVKASKGVNNGATGKTDLTVNTLLAKGLVDVLDYGYGKIFVGAGLGVTQISAKAKLSNAGVALALPKIKSQYKFGYLGTVGLSFDVSEGVIADLAYAYQGISGFNTKGYKIEYNTHDFTAGVRFEL